ncbi:50S ribosomal protein bL37 [Streptosporangium soli]
MTQQMLDRGDAWAWVLSDTRPRGSVEVQNPTKGGVRMARRARKSRARKKRKANHGKRPTAR